MNSMDRQFKAAHEYLDDRSTPRCVDSTDLELEARIKMALRRAYNAGHKAGQRAGRDEALAAAMKVAAKTKDLP